MTAKDLRIVRGDVFGEDVRIARARTNIKMYIERGYHNYDPTVSDVAYLLEEHDRMRTALLDIKELLTEEN